MVERSHIVKDIVEAAKERFSHYGYSKTTMCEIAKDCNMSPGNLYRYFPGKLDIAEEIADESTDRRLEETRDLIRRSDLSPSEKLREFLFAGLRKTFCAIEEDPRIYDLAQLLSKNRPEFANRQLAKERSLLAEILSAGNAAGVFHIKDVLFAAEMIQSATMKYKYPQLHSQLPLKTLERELDGVFRLIIAGLKATDLELTT